MPRDSDGVFHEPTNEDRRGWAKAALEAYCQAVESRPLESFDGQPEESLEAALSDLLNDLMHFVGEEMFERRLHLARRNFLEELVEARTEARMREAGS